MLSGSRTAIVTREVAQSLPSSLRISTSHTHVVRPRWNASCLARARCPRSPAAGSSCCSPCRAGPCPARARRRPCPSTPATPRSPRTRRRARCPSAGTRAATPASRAVRTPTSSSSSTSRPISRVEGVGPRQPPAFGFVGYVGHAADATCGVSAREERTMGAGTWESYHAITTLMFRYAECVDAADFDGIAALFAARPDHQRGRRRRDRRSRCRPQALRAAPTACTTTARRAPVTSTRT